MNELASHMQRGEDTLKRELLNLRVRAMPALILSEDEASTELHKEHHSRSAGLESETRRSGTRRMGRADSKGTYETAGVKRREKTRTPTIWRTKDRHTSGK